MSNADVMKELERELKRLAERRVSPDSFEMRSQQVAKTEPRIQIVQELRTRSIAEARYRVVG